MVNQMKVQDNTPQHLPYHLRRPSLPCLHQDQSHQNMVICGWQWGRSTAPATRKNGNFRKWSGALRIVRTKCRIVFVAMSLVEAIWGFLFGVWVWRSGLRVRSWGLGICALGSVVLGLRLRVWRRFGVSGLGISASTFQHSQPLLS
jgi:hypothetical protein